MKEIRFEDFITDEMQAKMNALSLAQRNEMLALNNLFGTDYQALKFAEGELTVEKYTEIKAKRIQWREEVNENRALIKVLKSELKELEDEARTAYEKAVEEQYKEIYGSYEELIYE